MISKTIQKSILINEYIFSFIILLLPVIAYCSEFPPACPSKKEVQQATLDQAVYNKQMNRYDVQTEKWIVSKRNWIISTSVQANSTKEAIGKANKILAKIKNNHQIKAKHFLSQDGNLILWICTWETNTNAKITALSMSVRE
jgi:hypothetical protein